MNAVARGVMNSTVSYTLIKAVLELVFILRQLIVLLLFKIV